ncbi:breast cancer type 2 susceptibility protein homolog isoform X2 [Pecten maximus]|uniref:breast cancer type 2 susceptibility protein homolog isoform X2 n=1 Tax=Pecten maximus TaxID=6579 RepID=UPI0014589C0B|nr:breast cancer type 2 susceptibility protein homolog isoform X2 [Pecten maximus]
MKTTTAISVEEKVQVRMGKNSNNKSSCNSGNFECTAVKNVSETHLSREAGLYGETEKVKLMEKSSRLTTAARKSLQMIDSCMKSSESPLDTKVNEMPNNNDLKSTEDFDTASRRQHCFDDSSVEKGILLFTEKDEEMDDMSSERMNGKIDMNSRDGKRHKNTDSDSKRSGLLEKDICQGIEGVNFNRIDEMTGVKTGKKHKLSSSVLMNPMPCIGDSDKVETDTPVGTLGGSLRNTAKLAGVCSASGFGGFSTAGGTKLTVSNTSLKKAMSLVSDVDVDVGDLRTVSEPDNSIAVMSTASKSAVFSTAGESGGFSTAGGKKLKVSDTSLKKAMSIIATVDDDTINTSDGAAGHSESKFSTDGGSVGNKSTETSTEDWLGGFNNVDGLGGFSTAGGKKLKLSENSMRKAMSIISEVEDTENRSLYDQCEKSSDSASVGFQTAGGKLLQISEAGINKGMSVMSEIDGEVLNEPVSFDKNSESVKYQKGRGNPVNAKVGDITDILNLSKRSESRTIKDKGFQTNTSRKSSSRFPPGANIPKGFRPFKPPKITKKPEVEKISDKQCMEKITKVPDGSVKQVIEETNGKHVVEVMNVIETTQTSKYSKIPSNSLDEFDGELHEPIFNTDEVSIKNIPEISKKDSGELQTIQSDAFKGSIKDIPEASKKDDVELAAIKINMDNIEGCINNTPQVSKGNKVQSKGSSLSTDVDSHRDNLPALKEEKTDQDIERSIMDELFSEELESSQHFSPGSGKILRSQKFSKTPRKQDRRGDVLPSEEYEEFLDIEDMVFCDAVERKCESLGNQTSKTVNEKYPEESVKVEDKSMSPVQHDRPMTLKTQSPVQHNGFSFFQSASGKNISVSEEAVRKAKQNLEDWSSKSTQEHSEQQTGYSKFQSSSGKNDSIPDSIVSKAKQPTDHSRAKNNDLTEIVGKVVETIVDSKSLSGKEFEVSVKPLTTPNMGSAKNIHKSSAEHTEFGGFQSASDRKVQVLDEALTEARQDISDQCSNDGEEPLHERAATIKKECLNQELFPEFSGFQSASGRKVIVSNNALVKARQNITDWCSDVGEEPLHEKAVSIKKECQHQELFPEFTGFQSASGKKVSVSNDAFVKARQNIRDWSAELNIHQSNVMESSTTSGDVGIDSKGDKSCVTPSNKDICEDVSFSGDNNEVKEEEWTVPKLGSFVNSSGKTAKSDSVKISGEEKIQQENTGLCVQNDHFSLQEVMNSQYDFSQDESNNDAEGVLGVEETKFQHSSEDANALRKNVSMSENAFKHGKKTMEDVGNSPFQSASGKKVSISENAIEHARKTMEDVGSSPFQSASGKKVNISENAIKHVQQTIKEVVSSPLQSTSDKKRNCIDDAFQHTKNNMEEVENSPFQSASGKKVNVSESALQNARKTMEDISNFPFKSGPENVLDMPSEPMDEVIKIVKDNLPTVMNREPKINIGENSISFSSPFQTATGSKISISESSLQHVRKTTANQESSFNVAIEDRKSLNSDMRPCSVEKAELTKLDKGPRLRYQITKAVSTVKEKQSSHSLCEENLITPSKQKQYKGPIAPRPCQQGSGFSPCVMSNTDRQVFIEGMNHSLDEFCQPDDFLEEMEVTPKRRRVEEKAGISRSGMVKPLKCVPEAFTRDRRGTNCSFRARHSTSTPTQESVSRSGFSVLTPSSNIKPQAPVKSSFLTPYKKPDTSKSDTDGTNPQTCTATQAAKRSTPKFIPKCLSTHQSNIVESKTCTSVQESPSENEQENKEEKSVKLYMLELLEGARKHQAELLKAKEKNKISPDPGRLYTAKKGKIRLKMRDVIKLHTRYVGRSQHHPRHNVGKVGAATAVQHKFYLPDFYTNFQGYVYVGDGAYLVPDDKLYAGKDELFRAFSTLAGVDCRLISDVWFYNHYRWLVWKLAAYEVTSPQNFAGRALTPEVIMLQMKYRYDREIDNCQRSALKKIMERDDTSSKRMVLCVCGINQPSQSGQTDITTKQADRGDRQTSVTSKQPSSIDKLDPQVCVELTDGWYSIAARLDVPLSDLVSKHRIRVGDKLCLSGAELQGPQEACTPLEAPASLMLKLYTNSTRPAPWDAKLGYQSDPRPLCISLSGLYGEGGSVGCLDVVLARKYPQMYMEKLSEGGCVFRTGLAEDKFQHQHQQHRQEEMEKLYAKLQREFESEDAEEKCISKKKWTKRDVELMQTGHEIYEAYSTSRQPDMIEEYLSDRQRDLLMERRRQVQDEKQQKLHAEFQKTWQKTSERTAIPLVKMKFVGCSRKDMDSKASTTVTVWRPTQDVMELTEGTRYKIFGLNASSSRARFKQCDVQLTATRQTRFMPVAIDENLLDMVYEPREVLNVRDIKCRQPLYGEADFVGMVVSVSTLNFAESGRHQDVVYAVDVNGCILGIKFWGGLKSFSLEEVLCEGRLFCASNLMDKSVYRSSILPLLEANLECSAVSQTSQYPAQRRALDRLKSVSTGTHGFLETAKEHLSALQQQKNENTKKLTPEKNLKQGTLDPLDLVLKTPDEGKPVLKTPDEGRPSNPSTQSVEEGSMPPATSNRAYQARMARLLNFGSPAPLSPLVSNTSRSVNKVFKPPVRRRKSLGPNH